MYISAKKYVLHILNTAQHYSNNFSLPVLTAIQVPNDKGYS